MLTQKQKKALIVLVCIAILVVLLSLIGPGYEKICTYTDHPYHEYCAYHNVVYAALWHIFDGLNYFGPAVAGVATIAVAVFTWTLWRSTDRSSVHFRVSERAYVKVSPYEPGIKWDEPGKGGFTIAFRIKNFGNTPANVTDVVTNAIVVPNDMRISATECSIPELGLSRISQTATDR